MKASPLRARRDDALRAQILWTEPLYYSDRGAVVEDRPAHVRAASAIRRWGKRLVIVQDDANILALRAPEGDIEASLLPRGEAGRRLFDDTRGNKGAKLDLEACVILPDGRLLALGSGSTRRRERLVVATPAGAAALRDASPLYAALRADTRFSGSELNVEGAVVAGGVLRLFQRGNGAPRGDLAPVNATCDVDLGGFCRWLDDQGPLPALTEVRQYDLGEISGVPFGFTDAAVCQGGAIAFLAVAEASPDATRDGQVRGCRFGFIGAEGLSYTDVVDASGGLVTLKLEGLASDLADPTRFSAVADMDRPEEPSLLCELRISRGGEGFSFMPRRD